MAFVSALLQHCFGWFILVQSVFDPTASRSVGSGERFNPNAREFTGILNVVKSYSLSWLFWHSPQMFKEFHCACLTQNQHHKTCRKTQNSIWSESWTRIWWSSRHKPLSGWHSCPRPAKRDNKVYKKIAAVQRCLQLELWIVLVCFWWCRAKSSLTYFSHVVLLQKSDLNSNEGTVSLQTQALFVPVAATSQAELGWQHQ